MTNSQSKFRSGTTAFLTLVVFAGIIAGVYLDLDHAIQQGNEAHLHQRLILWTVLMSLPGVITAFLLGFSVRLVTNPKTRWLLPSILAGAGAGIAFRAVANKVEANGAQKPPIRVPLAPASGKVPLPPPKGAAAVQEPAVHAAKRLKDVIVERKPDPTGHLLLKERVLPANGQPPQSRRGLFDRFLHLIGGHQ
jgi:hypothetical protein